MLICRPLEYPPTLRWIPRKYRTWFFLAEKTMRIQQCVQASSHLHDYENENKQVFQQTKMK